jgi:hypothetical protein
MATLDLDKQRRGERGFAAVRLVDRTLIFIPFGAILLMMLCLRYMAMPFQSRRVLFIMTALAAALWAFPYGWEALSTQNWQAYIETVPAEQLFGPNGAGLRAAFGNEALTELFADFLGYLLYSTEEQRALGAVVTVLCGFLSGAVLADRSVNGGLS